MLAVKAATAAEEEELTVKLLLLPMAGAALGAGIACCADCCWRSALAPPAVLMAAAAARAPLLRRWAEAAIASIPAWVASGMAADARRSLLTCTRSFDHSSEPPESIGRLHAQKNPRRARERATQTRLSTEVKPRRPSMFERTRESSTMSFSSPWEGGRGRASVRE